MTEHAPCPRCGYANPPGNRFCGWCGTPVASRELVPRRGRNLAAVGRTLPAKLGPAGKTLAVGLATLAAEAGLSWLRHRIKAEDLSSTRASREAGVAVAGRLFGKSLEEMLIHEQDHGGRILARRTIRSFVIATPIDRR
jgi:hypothetical protein